MPPEELPRQVTKVDHRYQIKGDPILHLSECLLIVYPDEPRAAIGTEGVRCTCLDWHPDADTG